MIYIILIISFLLDSFFLSVIGPNSILFPLCSLMSLTIIYPFLKKTEYNKFLIICIFMGMLYDVVFTGTPLLNIGLFLLTGIIIKLVFRVFSNNFVSNILTGILIIFIYRTFNYLILCLAKYVDFSILALIRGIYSSLIINIIYIIISYSLGLLISNKFKIQRFS